MRSGGVRARPRTRRTIVVAAAALLLTLLGLSAAVVVLTSHRKVLLVGDSLMWQAAPAVSGDLQRAGYQVQVVAYPGTGLLDARFDWSARIRQLVAQDRPDLVVVEFVGNYGLFGARPGIANDRTLQFYGAWQAAAQEATDVLASRHAQVYWVLGPPMARPDIDTRVGALNTIYLGLRAPASPAGRPLFVDEAKPFSDSQGKFVATAVGPGGTPVPLRTPDGVHLASPAGTQRFADAITAAITSGRR